MGCSLFGQTVYQDHSKKRDLGEKYYPYHNSVILKPNKGNKALLTHSIKKNVDENNLKTKDYLSFYQILLAADPKEVQKNIIKDNKTEESSIFLDSGSIKDTNAIKRNILPDNAKVVQNLAKKNKVALSADVKENLEEIFALYNANQEISESNTSKNFSQNEVQLNEVENVYSMANEIKDRNLKWYKFYNLE